MLAMTHESDFDLEVRLAAKREHAKLTDQTKGVDCIPYRTQIECCTMQPTCPNTCQNTCANTCQNTCGNTCQGATCKSCHISCNATCLC